MGVLVRHVNEGAFNRELVVLEELLAVLLRRHREGAFSTVLEVHSALRGRIQPHGPTQGGSIIEFDEPEAPALARFFVDHQADLLHRAALLLEEAFQLVLCGDCLDL